LPLENKGMLREESKLKQIKREDKDKLKNDIQWIWCPLFGSLPIIAPKYLYPSSIISRCISIIDEARSIFGIESQLLNLKSLDPEFIEQKTGISKNIILVARAILERSATIILNSQHYSCSVSGEHLHIKVDDKIKEILDPDQVDIDVLQNEISFTIGVIDYYELEDYKIFLLLAISEAYYLMEDILDGDCADDDNYSLKNIRMIELLLNRAKKIKRKVDSRKGPESKKNITKEFCKFRIKKSASSTNQSVFDYLKNNHKKSKPWKKEGRGIYWRPSHNINTEEGIIVEYDIKTNKIIKNNNLKSFYRNFSHAKIEMSNEIKT